MALAPPPQGGGKTQPAEAGRSGSTPRQNGARGFSLAGTARGGARWPDLLLALVAIVLVAGPARAVELARDQQVAMLEASLEAFDRATELRRSEPTRSLALFRESADGFQLLVDSGIQNGRLYYNLGNACLQSGQLGRAILNYRRAERLIPDDPRLVENLGYARSLRRNQIAPGGQQAFLSTLFFWHASIPLRWRYGAALLAFAAFWLLLAVRTWRRRFPWGYALGPVCVLWITLGISTVVDLRAPAAAGVVLVDEVPVRKGHGDGYELQFEQKLHEGVEFLLREQRGDWLRIELPDGSTGWIRARQAARI